MKADSLVQPLFDGPLDIVGDVHGEIAALTSLMHHLGYDNDGTPLATFRGNRLHRLAPSAVSADPMLDTLTEPPGGGCAAAR